MSESRNFSELSHQSKTHQEFPNVREITGNLFKGPKDYSLVHCVAEDMNMSSGIAVEFRHEFQRVDELLNQDQRTGGLAVLRDRNRFIYYLVTKKLSTGKPTLQTLFSSLKCLREHVMENKVEKIAMPRIGCGLDRLDWSEVKAMIQFLFKDLEVEIVVCNLDRAKAKPQKHISCRVAHEEYAIQEIASGTVIIYFTSEDGFVSGAMEKLEKKFRLLQEFNHTWKTRGEVIFHSSQPGYLLCGCVVKKTESDSFDFVALQKCLSKIQKENKKHNHYYYAFQAMHDRTDSCLNNKIINILKNGLSNAQVCVCWSGDFENNR